MTVQFSRSVRSIQADNFGPMLVGSAFFSVIMCGWLLWLFLATIPYYENSTTATYQPDGYIMATFSAPAFNRLRRGQPAQFRPLIIGSTAPAIPLVVTDLYPETSRARLVLRIEDEDTQQLQSGGTGEVEITVEQLTPIQIVLRSAGLLPNS